jgi:cation diffusion facilitator CzcD-associated flavoprotein CzcO
MEAVGIIGAGVSGMATALRLQRKGVPFTIFEKAGDVGGTWRDNRYPGLSIDVPAPIYTFEGDRHPGWRRWLPPGGEVQAYLRDVSVRHGLREHIRFDSEVVEANWTGERWRVRTIDGEEHEFRVLVCASGFLHHPKIPDIPGLDTFAGRWVHSARWEDDIVTEGRRVGVVGSGSSGVQITGALAGVASHLTLFQRTPQWIFPLTNFDIPRWMQSALRRSPRLYEGVIRVIDEFADWFLGGVSARDGRRRAILRHLGRRQLETVRDPALRAKLTPKDEVLCKRPVVSNVFYPAVQRPDVSVVDTAIERVCPEGVVTVDGALHELDVLILATGFDAHLYMRPMAINGEGGATLAELWAEGPYAYRTVSLPGFPNLFTILGPHSPLVYIPIHYSAELQSEYVAQMLDVLDRDGVVSVAPSREATERWLEEVRAGLPGSVWSTGCTSWYLGSQKTPVLWPYGRRRWRDSLARPKLEDYEISVA